MIEIFSLRMKVFQCGAASAEDDRMRWSRIDRLAWHRLTNSRTHRLLLWAWRGPIPSEPVPLSAQPKIEPGAAVRRPILAGAARTAASSRAEQPLPTLGQGSPRRVLQQEPSHHAATDDRGGGGHAGEAVVGGEHRTCSWSAASTTPSGAVGSVASRSFIPLRSIVKSLVVATGTRCRR